MAVLQGQCQNLKVQSYRKFVAVNAVNHVTVQLALSSVDPTRQACVVASVWFLSLPQAGELHFASPPLSSFSAEVFRPGFVYSAKGR